MLKYKWTRLLLLLTITILLLPSELPPTTATEQTPSWNNFFGLVRQRKRRQITRGDICNITPSDNQEKIWSTRPLFLWKGNVGQIVVRAKGSKTDYLRADVTNKNQASATKPLQAGQEYNILVLRPGESNPTRTISFQVMPKQERDRIRRELRALEAELGAKKASKEEIALQKASYFEKQELWADALQQAYSVPNPSPELVQFIQDFPNQFCTPSAQAR